MHYACTVEGSNREDALSGRNYDPSFKIKAKMAIIGRLFSYGAQVDQENLDGWTPPCIAALYMLMEIVDMFLDDEDFEIPLTMKIKVSEILGVSSVTLYPQYVFDEGVDSLSRALGLRQGILPKARCGDISELVACLSKLSLQECLTAAEFDSVKRQSSVDLKAHAFLVGDRLYPKKLKQKYLYPALVNFGCELMWDLNMLKEGRHVLSCALGFEHKGETKLGLVVEKLAEITRSYDDEESYDQYLQCVQDLLCECKSVLNHIHIDSLSDHCNSLLENFGDLLFSEAFYCLTVDILLSTLQGIEKLVKIIRGRILRENPDKVQELSLVTFRVMQCLNQEIFNSFNAGGHVHVRPLCRVKFVLRKTLFYERASYRDRKDWSTLLYLFAYSASSLNHLEHLEDLVWVFVRHGCPVDAVNTNGETARDVLIWRGLYDPERYPRLITLMSPPTTALTLEELAIRQILQKDISYLGEVPTCLYGMIKGRLKDSDLERANHESVTNEERE